jgi:carboxypeptidase Taq
MELLGVDTRGNYKDGAMQDVHWPRGVRLLPLLHAGRDVRGAVVRGHAPRHAGPGRAHRPGDLAAVFDWLRDNIWRQASRWTTDELALRASGEVLNPAHFKAHLEARATWHEQSGGLFVPGEGPGRWPGAGLQG